MGDGNSPEASDNYDYTASNCSDSPIPIMGPFCNHADTNNYQIDSDPVISNINGEERYSDGEDFKLRLSETSEVYGSGTESSQEVDNYEM